MINSSELYILCGLPFAGKSYLAQKLATYTNSQLIAFDVLWLELEKDPRFPTPVKGAEGWILTRQIAKERIKVHLKNHQTVVYDDINVGYDHREELKVLAEQSGATAVVIYVKTPEVVRMARMKQNLIEKKRHHVESENLHTATAQFEEPNQAENVIIYDNSMNVDEWLESNFQTGSTGH